MLTALLVCLALAQLSPGDAPATRSIEIPLNRDRDVSVADIVRTLAKEGRIEVAPPASSLPLPVDGLAGRLTQSLLADCLGPEFVVTLRRNSLALTFDESLLASAGRAVLKERLTLLAERAERAAKARQDHGMTALASYRPNDPNRPTICLVHGLNSSSGGFTHMVRPLEEAGYGIVVFDYPFNRPLEESCERLRRDWRAFRRQRGETRPWAIVAHSMGCLVARSLVEADDSDQAAREVTSLVMIAPVNQGSHIARLQNVLQFINGVKALNDAESARAFAVISDGVGKAAEDLLPGSRFLGELNRHDRRAGVAYHILAGDVGLVTREGRDRLQARIDEVTRLSGLLGTLARAGLKDLPELLDEICDGTGDGCVSVERTRLAGVADHQTIHANHAELIRAPILFADPGPVACIPSVLKWLEKDLPARPTTGAERKSRP